MLVFAENRFGSWGSCVFHIWASRVEAQQLDALTDLTRQVAAQHGGHVTMLALVEQGVPIVSTDERKLIEAFYADMAPYLSSVAQCVEGGNLWAVTARSVMTAIRLVQRKDYALRVFSDVEQATGWLAADTEPPNGQRDADVARGLSAYLKQLRVAKAS